MKRWQGALFAFLLLFAQTAALLHAFEHRPGAAGGTAAAAGFVESGESSDSADSTEPAGHACAFCLAAHGLDAPLAAAADAAPLLSFAAAPAPASFYLSPAPAPPVPGARAPPFA